MNYYLSKDVMQNPSLREAFDKLAVQTFDLSFEEWYQKGYWSGFNQPYALFHREKAVANVSVNNMEILWNGRIYNCIQLGTVMTDIEYRGQGLSRYLIEEVIRDWEGKCDAMFLFANDSVLDFYPKFGFERVEQYQYHMEIDHGCGGCRKLDIDSCQDREMLMYYYHKRNPFSKVQVINNESLLMFYCISVLKDCIYYSSEYDAVVVAEQENGLLKCYDIYCESGKSLTNILSAVAEAGTRRVSLEFTPYDGRGFETSPIPEDYDCLFMRTKAEKSGWIGERMMFPAISHT